MPSFCGEGIKKMLDLLIMSGIGFCIGIAFTVTVIGIVACFNGEAH